jgi:hypothetical protein
VDSGLIEADRDRGFADWGATVVLRRVAQAYDAETGLLTETYEDRSVVAIAGEAGLAAVAGTAGQAGRFAQLFLARREDVEGEDDLRGLRVVYAGEQFRVDDVEAWSQAGMVLMKCVRV